MATATQVDTIGLDDVEFSSKCYPREKPSTSVIERYADCIRAGDTFPPIVCELGTGILLDGYHRWKAHLRYLEEYEAADEETRKDWPLPPNQIAVEYHEVPEGVPTILYAASLSANHGDAIKGSDRKRLAREIIAEDENFNTVTLAKYLGVSQKMAHNYVGDMLAKKREERAAKAYRLKQLGWTQSEIGESLKVTQKSISLDLEKIEELLKGIKSQVKSGLPIEDVATRHGLPLDLAYAIAMDGMEDAERLGEDYLNIKLQPYDVWNFAKCHDLMGDSHPGRIPGELICHVLYFYTKPGDVVIDPMVGSGTTLDACLLMGRKCFGFDIDGRHGRVDVIKHNIAKDGWHGKTEKAKLIFWDPPYYDKMDGDNLEGGYVEGSVSGLSQEKYLEFFTVALSEAHAKVKPGTKLAFLMSDWDDGKDNGIFVWDYARIIQEAGWKLIRHIQAPLSTQLVHPDIVNKHRKNRKLARLERYLLIAEA